MKREETLVSFTATHSEIIALGVAILAYPRYLATQGQITQEQRTVMQLLDSFQRRLALQAQRPSLRLLLERHHVSINDLARASEIEVLLVWAMYVGRPTTREDAQAIVQGLNRLCNTRYTLDDISVVFASGE
ncbi:hypothetical protein KTH_25190 [Thermosporothrix hazakensis]|nr:hypothetical protein KTH_25190 [Thermosporothrix hazakensis]